MQTSATKAERKYLTNHAEPEAQLIGALQSRSLHYTHAVVIPAYGEGENLFRALETIPRASGGRVLIILVVNAPRDAPTWVHEANHETLRTLEARPPRAQKLTESATLHTHANGDLLLIDRARENHFLPSGEGVGLARKLGADLALAASTSGVLKSEWIHCSDADVEFPQDYFRQTDAPTRGRVSARLYRFRHRSDSNAAENEAALQYEISLRYYVLGLGYSGSPYAFHSVGSTMAVHTQSYAQVRGFPRRQAAEDFYLLNKLAKVGRVDLMTGDPICPSSRVSSRVPFGTGAAIGHMLKGPSSELLIYHPQLFVYLRVWERTLARAIGTQSSEATLRTLVEQSADETPSIDPGRLVSSLEKTGVLAKTGRALEAPVRASSRHIRDSFDGFRTLKLLHSLRDHDLTDLPLREALLRAPFISLPPEPTTLSTPELAHHIETLDHKRTAGGSAEGSHSASGR